MDGKVVIVTGATSGIGLETARSLAHKGFKVNMACRDREKGAGLAAEIIEQSGNHNLDVLHVEMASLQAVRVFAESFAANHDQLHVLVNNAGGFYDRLQKTGDGFEMTMGVNYLAPFLLTRLVLPLLQKTPGARIVNIGSKAAFHAKLKLDKNIFTGNTYGFKAYAASKLAQLLFTIELAEELTDKGVTVNTAYPGRVATNIWQGSSLLMRLVSPIMMRNSISPEEGAKTGVYLATSPAVESITGKMFDKEKVLDYNRICLDRKLRKGLMGLSFDALKLGV